MGKTSVPCIRTLSNPPYFSCFRFFCDGFATQLMVMGTITKALNLLNYFSSTTAEIGLAEFKSLSSQDKATVYRYLRELELNGFVEQNPLSKNYRLGPAVLRLAAIRESTFPARDAVSARVDALSRELGELVHATFFQQGGMSPFYHADVQMHGTRVHFDAAELLPFHATASGLAMLAFGSDSLRKAVLESTLVAYTGMTITQPAKLKTAITNIRQRGYASCDQGFEKEVYAIAAPIFAQSLEVVGTLAVAVPSSRINKSLKRKIIKALKSGCADVSTALGGAVPDSMHRLWCDAA